MKPGTRVKTLTLESAELAAELQQDLGVLGMRGVPQELRTCVTGDDLPLMPIVPLFMADICFCVCGYKFYCHKVTDSRTELRMGRSCCEAYSASRVSKNSTAFMNLLAVYLRRCP